MASNVQARGKKCGVCGEDEWRRRKSASRGGSRSGKWACVRCDNRRSREYQRRRRGDVVTRLWESARDRARRRGLDFTITAEDVRAVLPPDGRCPVTGKVMVAARKYAHATSPTLDRLNNAWGYVPGNIAVISYRANKLKGDATARELRRVAEWMESRGLS